jgi:hypothetical protein
MKLTPWFLAAFAPIAVAGCSGTMLGHLAVLAVTVGIFVGTLSLGRHTGPAAPASTAGTNAAQGSSIQIGSLNVSAPLVAQSVGAMLAAKPVADVTADTI